MRRRHVLAGAAVLAVSASAAVVPLAAGAPTSKPLFATLTGANEPAGGDTNGTGAATVLIVSPTRLCYSLVVNSIAKPLAAHIHSGVRGKDGNVVVPLKQPGTGNGGVSAACVTAPRDVVSGIKASPAKFYVNVHTSDFPGGAIRGQLAAR